MMLVSYGTSAAAVTDQCQTKSQQRESRWFRGRCLRTDSGTEKCQVNQSAINYECGSARHWSHSVRHEGIVDRTKRVR